MATHIDKVETQTVGRVLALSGAAVGLLGLAAMVGLGTGVVLMGFVILATI